MTVEIDLSILGADILVVDDTIGSLRMLTEILTKAGYNPRPVEEPQFALEVGLAQPPDLILLDVKMPKMNGFEFCQRLKQDERTCDVPVIFVSALDNTEDRVRGFEVGGVDFISKPIQEAEVLARVNTHLQLRNTQLHLQKLVAERTAELTATNESLKIENRERKRVQQALKESEEKYRTVVEQATDGIMVVQDLQRKFYNQAMLDIIGYSKEEYTEIAFHVIDISR